MIAKHFAPGYRKTAQVWRRKAAEMRTKMPPDGLFNAEQVAGLWEARAEAFELLAPEIEAQGQVSAP